MQNTATFLNSAVNQKTCPAPNCGKKYCLLVTRVLDSALIQQEYVNQTVTLGAALTDLTLQNTGIVSTSTVGTVSGLQIRRLNSSDASRVTLTVSVPLSATFTSATGDVTTVPATTSFTLDVVMCVPTEDTVFPYVLDAAVNVVSEGGTITNETTVTANMCVVLILRILTEGQICINAPVCPLRDVVFFNDENFCLGRFARPLYPS